MVPAITSKEMFEALGRQNELSSPPITSLSRLIPKVGS